MGYENYRPQQFTTQCPYCRASFDVQLEPELAAHMPRDRVREITGEWPQYQATTTTPVGGFR